MISGDEDAAGCFGFWMNTTNQGRGPATDAVLFGLHDPYFREFALSGDE
jgi:hypothetical protein